jgi:hypothetical protein
MIAGRGSAIFKRAEYLGRAKSLLMIVKSER